MVRTELRKIIGRDVFCVAKSDDDTYWDISFPLERLPLSDLHRILEALDATDSQRDLSLPPEEDHADSVSSLSMTVCQLLLRRNLGYDWECLHLAKDSFWILGVKDTPETDDFIKIGSQRFPLGELKNRQEVLEHLRENGASHRALMDICEEYLEKYQNELCWYYPTTDELHLGTFLLLVKEGVLSLPFNEVDSVDYELFCLSAVWTRMFGKTSRLTRRKVQWSSFWMILSTLPAEVSLRIIRTPMKRKDIRQHRRHRQRPHPQITAAALPATSRLAEAIPSLTKTERQQLNRAYKRRT